MHACVVVVHHEDCQTQPWLNLCSLLITVPVLYHYWSSISICAFYVQPLIVKLGASQLKKRAWLSLLLPMAMRATISVTPDVYLARYTVGAQKRFTFRLRRTVEKRSVPFPLYGQPFRGTLFALSENGQLYGVRSRNGNGTEVFS